MDLAPLTRQALSDEIFVRLAHEILSAGIAPGDALPAERELAESFAVNRHAVREALKRLRQAGLVQISQGGKTRVLDWRTHAGLDVLAELVHAGVVPPRAVLRDVAEMRRSVGADAIRACTERADDATLAAVADAAARYPEPSADVDFWSAVIDGSQNLAYRLAYNTLLAAILELGVETFPGLLEEHEDRETHVALAALMQARDAGGAHRHALTMLSHVVEVLSAPEIPVLAEES